MYINLKHLIKSSDPEEIYNFVASANFALKLIKAGKDSEAKRYGNAYFFAKANEDMDSSDFAIETGKLINATKHR